MTNWNTLPVSLTQDRLMIGNHQVMQRWEEPVMKAMASACDCAGNFLEIGFGMGILAGYVCDNYVFSYTIIEPHPMIVLDAHLWRDKCSYEPEKIKIIPAFWQDAYKDLPQNHYDAILFDIFPPVDDPQSADMVEMIEKMYPLLISGGVLTYYSGMESVLPTGQMQTLMRLFNEVTLRKVPVEPYPDCHYFKGKQMIVPFARK